MVDPNEIKVEGCNFVMFNTNGDINQYYAPHPLLRLPSYYHFTFCKFLISYQNSPTCCKFLKIQEKRQSPKIDCMSKNKKSLFKKIKLLGPLTICDYSQALKSHFRTPFSKVKKNTIHKNGLLQISDLLVFFSPC
jgi:hypothetical protein